jgi:hypothetical protein
MSTFRNLIKIAAFGAVVYGAYKYGKSVGNNNQPEKNENLTPDDKNFSFQEIDQTESEEKYVLGLIQELKDKPNKTQKDRYTIELLEIKLNQLKNKK